MATDAQYESLRDWMEFQLDTKDPRILAKAKNWKKFDFGLTHEDIINDIKRYEDQPTLTEYFYRNLGRDMIKKMKSVDPKTSTIGLEEFFERRLISGTKRDSWMRKTFPKEFEIQEKQEELLFKRKEENALERESAKIQVDTFARLEKEIQLIPDKTRDDIEALTALKTTIRRIPKEQIGTKDNKNELIRRIDEKRQNILAGVKGVQFNDLMDNIVRDINQAKSAEDLKGIAKDINILPTARIRDDLKRNLYKKRIDLNLPVQKSIREEYLGDFDIKVGNIKEIYGDNYFIEPKKTLKAYGFTEEEIDYLKEYRGQEPRIEAIRKPLIGFTIPKS